MSGSASSRINAVPPRHRTLERWLSRSGIASRTIARQWIAGGRVAVNGRVIRDPDSWIDPLNDEVLLDGSPITAPDKTYIAFHKPRGLITTRSDPEGRSTIYDLLPERYKSLAAVGRLDRDTSGLLLLTNDTDFAQRITSPESHVPKTYLIKASKFLSDESIGKLRAGVKLRDGQTRPAIVRRLRNPGGKTVLEITITEGRNRQVRRMVEAVGAKVVSLTRVAVGEVHLDDLRSGAVRELTASEIESLRR
jgi:23S rRNA pseudouridine2605 synthase